MDNIILGVKEASRFLNTISNNMENSIMRGAKKDVDIKVLNLVSRVQGIIKNIMYVWEELGKRVEGEADSKIISLAPYTYLFALENTLVFTRTRPETIVLTYNSNTRNMSFKARNFIMDILPSRLTMLAKSIRVDIDLFNLNDYSAKKDELKAALKMAEKKINYLTLLISQKILKKL
ncbi:MAG: hypothetical protein QXU13_01670 [Desulfurococcaceae archaeon]